MPFERPDLSIYLNGPLDLGLVTEIAKEDVPRLVTQGIDKFLARNDRK